LQDNSLVHAVDPFAALTSNLFEEDLEREWVWGDYDSDGVRFAFFRNYEELRELAVKTAALRNYQGPAITEAQRVLAQYHAAYRDLQSLTLGLDDQTAEQAPAEGEWSPKQVVAHIVSAQSNFYVVVRYALDRLRTEDGRPAEVVDEDWEELIGMKEAEFDQIMEGSLASINAFYTSLHERVLNEFADVDEIEIEWPSMYWEEQAMSLRFRLHRFDSHLRQHIVQMEKTLNGIGRTPNEARRLLRLIYNALAEVEGLAIGAPDVAFDLRQAAAEIISARTAEIEAVLR
jgi:hypothetical protein